MTDSNQHGQDILRIAHAVICGKSIEEAEMAFGALCTHDLEAAIHLADLLVLASPQSAPIWKAIIEYVAKNHAQAPNRIEQSGPDLSEADTQDTAKHLADHMGWLDVESGDKT